MVGLEEAALRRSGVVLLICLSLFIQYQLLVQAVESLKLWNNSQSDEPQGISD